jgi:hypothetical protein
MPFDHFQNNEGVILFKDLLPAVIVHEVLIEGGGVDIPVIEKVNFSEPGL